MALAAREIEYGDGETLLTGVLVEEAEPDGTHPGILLIHGGSGLDDHARGQAQRYAQLGYSVFACDMYGEGVAGDRERVMATLATLRDDPDVLVRRAQAGIDTLTEHGHVNERLGAVGFCFGGMSVLTLARAGLDLRGVVSMHGALKTPRLAEPGAVKAKVLACHGALDPHVPMTDLVTFVEEMEHAGVDYEVNVYGGAMHGFTHEHALPGAIHGVAYHAPTDRRSFAAATAFFAEALPG